MAKSARILLTMLPGQSGHPETGTCSMMLRGGTTRSRARVPVSRWLRCPVLCGVFAVEMLAGCEQPLRQNEPSHEQHLQVAQTGTRSPGRHCTADGGVAGGSRACPASHDRRVGGGLCRRSGVDVQPAPLRLARITGLTQIRAARAIVRTRTRLARRSRISPACQCRSLFGARFSARISEIVG